MARTVQRLLAPIVLVTLLVIVTVTMAAMSPYFLQTSNLLSALTLTVPIGIIAIGMTLVLLIGGIDLSVGSVLALSAVSLGLASEAGLPTVVCAVVPLVVGTVAGLVNGWIVSRFGLPAIVVTLATLAVFGGLALAFSGGRSLTIDSALAWIGLGTVAGIPTPAVVWVVVLAFGVLLLSRTSFGEYIYALGTSPGAARQATLRVRSLTLTVYGASGFLAGLAGLVMATMVSSAKSNFATGYELTAVTIAVVGGTALSGGRGTIWATALATLFIALLTNGLSISFVPTEVQTTFIGLALIVTAVVYRWGPVVLGRMAAGQSGGSAPTDASATAGAGEGRPST